MKVCEHLFLWNDIVERFTLLYHLASFEYAVCFRGLMFYKYNLTINIKKELTNIKRVVIITTSAETMYKYME